MAALDVQAHPRHRRVQAYRSGTNVPDAAACPQETDAAHPPSPRPDRVSGCPRRARRSSRPLGRLDAFLRRDDTWLAHLLAALSNTRGPAYTGSTAKRSLDLLLGIPLALLALVPLLLLLLLNKLLTPHAPALFLQHRMGRDGETLRVPKIRSLLPAADGPPTCTPFGRLIRRYYLDELPQLLLVLTGRLSLVGIRVLPDEVVEGLRQSWSRERFAAWERGYGQSALGLTGVQQVFRRRGKEDVRRYHRDRFYARHASLRFDLYLLWRTLGTTDSGPQRMSAAERGSSLQRSVPAVLLGLALLLVPWTLHLGLSPGGLASSAYTNRFWAGYDVAIIAAMSCTALLAAFRRREAAVTSAIIAMLLIADVWLDITSARSGWPFAMALARALFLEIPVAAFTLRLSYLVVRTAFRQAREELRDASPHRTRRTRGEVAAPCTRESSAS